MIAEIKGNFLHVYRNDEFDHNPKLDFIVKICDINSIEIDRFNQDDENELNRVIRVVIFAKHKLLVSIIYTQEKIKELETVIKNIQ